MSVVGHIRGFGFAKSRIRYIHSCTAIYRAIQTPSPSVENIFGDGEVPLKEDTSIFASKRAADILRSLFVLKLCSYDMVGRNSMMVSEDNFRAISMRLGNTWEYSESFACGHLVEKCELLHTVLQPKNTLSKKM